MNNFNVFLYFFFIGNNGIEEKAQHDSKEWNQIITDDAQQKQTEERKKNTSETTTTTTNKCVNKRTLKCIWHEACRNENDSSQCCVQLRTELQRTFYGTKKKKKMNIAFKSI